MTRKRRAILPWIGLALAAGAATLVFRCGSMNHEGGESATPALGSDPISPITSDAVIVVNGADASLSVIDAATLTVKGVIKLSGAAYPHHISVARDMRSIAVAAPGADFSAGHGVSPVPPPAPTEPAAPATPHGAGHGLQETHHGAASGVKPAILKLEAATGKTLVATQLPHPNHNAAFSPDGSEIWTGQMAATGTVWVLDANTLAVKQSLAVGKMPAEVTFSFDGTKAFVANGGDATVSVFDVASKSPVATVAVGVNPVGAWTGGDGVMYVDNETDKTISAIDAKTAAVVRTYSLGFTPGMAATSQSGELWVTNVDAGKVVIYSAGETTVAAEIQAGKGAHAIAFSADGASAFVTNQGEASVTVIDVATKMPKGTVAVGSKPNGLVFAKPAAP